MNVIGIDIGTTNISLVVLNLQTGEVVWSGSQQNKRIHSLEKYAYLQDPVQIEKSIRFLLAQAPPAKSICVTGQVHGILYYDKNGDSITPLYNWLDSRGCIEYGGTTFQTRLHSKTGIMIPSGYGLLTHYANRLMGCIPENAKGFTGILEYITGRLVGKPLEFTDSSCLAAFGGYDYSLNKINSLVINEVLGSNTLLFPTQGDSFALAGLTSEGILVSLPVGDNQAGFFGTVSHPERSCLISIGTSGQLSLFSPSSEPTASMEMRPYLVPGFLHVGATLCAGKAYEAIQKFIKSIFIAGKSDVILDEEVFQMMKEFAGTSGESTLVVTPTLNGTRRDSTLRGSISNIDLSNLTLQDLINATVNGIVEELHGFMYELGSLTTKIDCIFATGSAVRKNYLFTNALKRRFKMEVISLDVDNGAAIGAALIGAVSANLITMKQKEILVENIVKKATNSKEREL